jgi:hypothetical protein
MRRPNWARERQPSRISNGKTNKGSNCPKKCGRNQSTILEGSDFDAGREKRGHDDRDGKAMAITETTDETAANRWRWP